ncbi:MULTISPECIES: nucleotidyltransferase domain-containing protein [Bacillaceae]|uniref:Nucleotidyltransferase domain-containing protein n=1 Tax=Evansella alkalicola TaxID=745819 RepID=A0ABS6JYN7_9BACI|nr:MULTISPECIES: nucleotidyltransferase domain-containing protein [Bacillaceae]MBU9722774.1 nucleotidyltransferase domain-containing protein [Bacillus alkalicola]
MPKLDPTQAAIQFVNKNFPDCQGALLAGSVVRGQATETSDLDIVVFDDMLPSSYRESLKEFDWPIEVFAHNSTSYKDFFKSDVERARPSMPRMVSEGIIIKDEGVIGPIKTEAKELLEQGPAPWSEKTIELKRYFLTDALDDFIGCKNRAEGIFIANTLAEGVSEFVLRTNRQWQGSSKWVIRSLKDYDEDFADKFVEAFDEFYRYGEKDKVVVLVDEVLKPFGGRLFEGFSLGR